MTRSATNRVHGTIKLRIVLTIGGPAGAPIAIAVTCRGLVSEVIAAAAAILISALPAIAPHAFWLCAVHLITKNTSSAMEAEQFLRILRSTMPQALDASTVTARDAPVAPVPPCECGPLHPSGGYTWSTHPHRR